MGNRPGYFLSRVGSGVVPLDDQLQLASETLCIDGGGTKTWMRFTSSPSVAVAGPSTSVDLLGESSPRDMLVSLISSCMAKSAVAPERVNEVVVFHAAASTQAKADEYASLLGQVTAILGVSARIVVANDMVPLLYAGGPGDNVSLIAGTGTSAGSRSRDGHFGRIGGGDFVLSDQGGGFDVGMIGLRSVVKALDGRFPRSTLVDRAIGWANLLDVVEPVTAANFIEAAYGSIYGPSMRTRVASFAKEVCLAAEDGDVVAMQIVSSAAADLADSVKAAADLLSLDRYTVVVSGSLVSEGSVLGAALEHELSEDNKIMAYAWHESSDAVDIVEDFLTDISLPERLSRLRAAFPLVLISRVPSTPFSGLER